MRRLLSITNHAILFILFVVLFTSCMKDKIRYTYQINTPVYETLASYRLSIKTVPASAIINPGKIAVYGKYIFLSEPGKGIHVIDNSDPTNPKNISYINIPGNQDFAIKGNALYADAYGDLATFDISNPAKVITMNFLTNVFPDNSIYYATNSTNPDSINVIVSWITKDTTVDYNPSNINVYPLNSNVCINCYTLATAPSAFTNNANTSATGTNGSLSRFTIINNYLYTVDYSDLSAFSIVNVFNPSFSNKSTVDYHVETIYPFKDKLFIGTNNGVYMYDIQSSPGNPSLSGEFTHVRGCDPVIADNTYAYVTLNDSSACLGFYNQLQIVNIQDLNNSFLVKSYQLTHPIGLSKDSTNLFICDGIDGLKIFDATDINNLQLIIQLKDAEVYDVIAQNGLAIVMAKNGLYEYDYSDIHDVHLISKL